MSIVISDTSPLTNLAAIGRFELLKSLYGELYIADAVYQELNAQARSWPGWDEVMAARWIHRQTVQNHLLVLALRQDLDAGESESIVLALELNAEIILMDERDGRHKAQGLGLKTVGVVGILLAAKAKGILPDIKSCLDALRMDAGFYLGNPVYREALKLAGEL
jgi:predicted nucleic acid-binding protein